jgi:ABC-type transporter MlaC component
MQTKSFYFITFFIFLKALSTPTLAASSPKETVLEIIERAKNLSNKTTYSENTKKIESLVFFEKLTENALTGSNPSSDQRQKIDSLLKEIITKSVYPKAPQFFKDVKLDFSQSTAQQNQESSENAPVKISSTVTSLKNKTTNKVDYYLIHTSEGYKVTDFALEGQRWSESIREQFQDIIKKEGIHSLIQKLEKKTLKISSEASKKSAS